MNFSLIKKITLNNVQNRGVLVSFQRLIDLTVVNKHCNKILVSNRYIFDLYMSQQLLMVVGPVWFT